MYVKLRRCLQAYVKEDRVLIDAPGQLDTRGDGEVEIATAAALRQIVEGCRTHDISRSWVSALSVFCLFRIDSGFFPFVLYLF